MKVLPVITTLFAVSILGRSIALAVEYSDSDNADGNHPTVNSEAGVSGGETLPSCIAPALAQSLKKRQEEVDHAEQQLSEQNKKQQIVAQELKLTMADVDIAMAVMDEKVKLLEKTSRADIIHLTKMYENMKPKQAAEIFDKMDPVFAAGLLHGMKSNQAGLVMANMSPEKAYIISVMIANRLPEYRGDKPV
ncbi:MAG: hypothetical protein V3V30_02350 [Parvularculaceae bacterium]